ncbi:MAG: DUF3429 domain-containing protein [Rubrivivax sp.]|nr:DUF3429 domain-containing protein [Rubrivivax sp.]
MPGSLGRALGLAGLLPFVAGAAGVWLVDAALRPWVAQALVAYGALIVSFLGGIHWGLAARAGTAPPPVLLAWGVLPSLIAWPALLLPAPAALVLLAAALLLCLVVDRRLYPAHGAAALLPLRLRLTLVATVACVVGALA